MKTFIDTYGQLNIETAPSSGVFEIFPSRVISMQKNGTKYRFFRENKDGRFPLTPLMLPTEFKKESGVAYASDSEFRTAIQSAFL